MKIIFTICVCLMLSSCAIIQSDSTVDPAYKQKLSHVEVWSGLKNVNFLPGLIKPSTSFQSAFQSALLTKFAADGIDANYIEKTDTVALSANSSTTFTKIGSSKARLVILLRQSSYRSRGAPYLELAVFDLHLYSTEDNSLIWQAKISIDASIDVPRWGDATANKFVEKIFELLKKDGLA
jgi:hypothetical protein